MLRFQAGWSIQNLQTRWSPCSYEIKLCSPLCELRLPFYLWITTSDIQSPFTGFYFETGYKGVF